MEDVETLVPLRRILGEGSGVGRVGPAEVPTAPVAVDDDAALVLACAFRVTPGEGSGVGRVAPVPLPAPGGWAFLAMLGEGAGLGLPGPLASGRCLETQRDREKYQNTVNHMMWSAGSPSVAYQPLPGLSCLYRPVGVLRSKNVGE